MTSDPSRREPLALVLLRRHAAEHGLTVFAEPAYGYAGYVEAPGGARAFFKGAGFDLNPAAASAIARDKAYGAFFLEAADLRVPRGVLISSQRFIRDIEVKNPAVAARLNGEAQALAFARETGFPLFVKPNDDSEGRGILRVQDEQGLSSALAVLGASYDRILVQEEVRGRDYRVLVLDGEVLAVFERRPFSVTGDGVSPLRALITQATQGFAAGGKGSKIAADDPRILAFLATSGLDLTHVPQAGAAVALLPNANLSSGGSAVDVSGAISPYFSQIAREAGEAVGLRLYGLDLICPDIAAASGPYAILEVNAAPGLSHFHRLGPQEALRVEEIYAKIFGALTRSLGAGGSAGDAA